jgi:hypothetical protein
MRSIAGIIPKRTKIAKVEKKTKVLTKLNFGARKSDILIIPVKINPKGRDICQEWDKCHTQTEYTQQTTGSNHIRQFKGVGDHSSR